MEGVEFMCVQGVKGLKDVGVLQGVRAMAARVYDGETWYILPCRKTLATLRCELKTRPGLALGPLGAP